MAIKRKVKDTSFQGIDLNESVINGLFNECLATDNTSEHIKSILYRKDMGFGEDSDGILFDRKKILENVRLIRYLYGQLITTHNRSNTINASVTTRSNVMTNYKGTIWTTNEGVIMMFYHLGVASGTIYPFSVGGSSSFKGPIEATLSPQDLNFPVWWEAHKSVWETEQ